MNVAENVMRNKMVREDVAEAAELLLELAERCPNEELFWEELAKTLCDHLPREETQVVKARPFTDEEAKAFGNHMIGFGQHAAKTYNQAPVEYLDWLDERGRELSRYLASDYVRRER